ncbi:Chloramphenicol acetyltransferase [Serratia rubidaea]|uniref:Chloramphenicol acetyltransferase n=1 Tax=Serratia rubidaea TaxID=61652 RepID=A0A4U9HRK7_SERRU|nr:Chloramphenicol acetyltransferase [Serratia rubidaea]
MSEKHWSKIELLHQTVTNPNIIVKGSHSYYSDCWDNGFERDVVRYLHGDAYSRQWEPLGKLDRLLIGNFVCIAAETVILMGGNHTHRTDWLSLYPFMASIQASYQPRGDTRLGDGCWIGMRAMLNARRHHWRRGDRRRRQRGDGRRRALHRGGRQPGPAD